MLVAAAARVVARRGRWRWRGWRDDERAAARPGAAGCGDRGHLRGAAEPVWTWCRCRGPGGYAAGGGPPSRPPPSRRRAPRRRGGGDGGSASWGCRGRCRFGRRRRPPPRSRRPGGSRTRPPGRRRRRGSGLTVTLAFDLDAPAPDLVPAPPPRSTDGSSPTTGSSPPWPPPATRSCWPDRAWCGRGPCPACTPPPPPPTSVCSTPGAPRACSTGAAATTWPPSGSRLGTSSSAGWPRPTSSSPPGSTPPRRRPTGRCAAPAPPSSTCRPARSTRWPHAGGARRGTSSCRRCGQASPGHAGGLGVHGTPLAPSLVTRHYSQVCGAGGIVAADPGIAGYWVARTFATTELGGAQVPADGRRPRVRRRPAPGRPPALAEPSGPGRDRRADARGRPRGASTSPGGWASPSPSRCGAPTVSRRPPTTTWHACARWSTRSTRGRSRSRSTVRSSVA